MKRDPRIIELHEVLDPIARVKITEVADEVNVIVPKPVDIGSIDNALLRARYAEPLDRLERPSTWHIRLMKREKERPKELGYVAVRVMDSYYEYRPDPSRA